MAKDKSDANMGELTIIAPEGTEKLIWDPRNPEETGPIKRRFDQLLEKGYSAFHLRETGAKAKKFHPSMFWRKKLSWSRNSAAVDAICRSANLYCHMQKP